MIFGFFGWAILTFLVIYILAGIRIIRPTTRGLIETLGKFTSYREPGFNWIFPIFQHMIYVNVTETMADVDPQEIITKDNLNAQVDLVVFYKIRKAKDETLKAIYNANDYESQIVTLARTTARNVIGDMMFKDVNSKRNELNEKLRVILDEQTDDWGIEVVRVELKEITPPKDVQDTMNKVIKAENEKTAAVDFATAAETVADGKRRASIKEAEGIATAKVIVAKSEAERIKLVNESAKKYFIGNAQKLRQMDVTQASLENNAKIILTEKGINPTLLIGNIATKEEK